MDRSRCAAGTGVVFLVASLGFLLALTAPPARATPWTGSEPTPTDLVLYLHNGSAGIPVGAMAPLDVISTVSDTQRPWAGTGGLSVSRHYNAVSFVIAPQLAGNLTLDGNLTGHLYANESGSSPNGGSIVVSVALVTPSGATTVLGVGPPNPTSPLGPGGSLAKPIVLAGPDLHRTVAAGDTLMVNVTVSGNAAEGYGLWWGQIGRALYPSSVTIPSSSYLTISSLTVRGPSGAPVTALGTDSRNRTVTVTALANDPLGAYDFATHPVDLTMTSPSGATIVSDRGMSPLTAGSTEYSVEFNYSALPLGRYHFEVNATDNTNHDFWAQDTLPAHYGRAASVNTTLSVVTPTPSPGGSGAGSAAGVPFPWVWILVVTGLAVVLWFSVRRWRRSRPAPSRAQDGAAGSSAPVAPAASLPASVPRLAPTSVAAAEANDPTRDGAPTRPEPDPMARDPSPPIRLVDRARILAASAVRVRVTVETDGAPETPAETTTD